MGMSPQALHSVIQLILSYLHVSMDLNLRRFIITMAAALSMSVNVDAVAGVTLITILLMELIMFSKETATMYWSEKSFQNTISVSMLKTIIAMLQIILLARSM